MARLDGQLGSKMVSAIDAIAQEIGPAVAKLLVHRDALVRLQMRLGA